MGSPVAMLIRVGGPRALSRGVRPSVDLTRSATPHAIITVIKPNKREQQLNQRAAARCMATLDGATTRSVSHKPGTLRRRRNLVATRKKGWLRLPSCCVRMSCRDRRLSRVGAVVGMAAAVIERVVRRRGARTLGSNEVSCIRYGDLRQPWMG